MSGPGGWLPPSGAGPEYVPPPERPLAPPPPGSVAYGAARPPVAPLGASAPYASRVGAALLDALVRLGIVLGFAAVGAILFVFSAEAGAAGLLIGVIVGGVAGIAYAPVWMARTNGQTIGHRAVGTRVVRQDGRPMDGSGAFVREVLVKALLIEGLGSFLFAIPALLNYLWPLWDERDEALHDKLCKTRVVRA